MTQIESAERKGGRPRSEDADRAIVEATLELVADFGLAALTIEGVAAQAGVGKTTVYRRWPNKEALVVDAIAHLKGPVPKLPHRSLREDLLLMFKHNADGREAARRRRIYACFVGESARNPEFSRRYFEAVLEPRHEVVRQAIRAAMQRGEVRDDLDVEEMRYMIMAPMLVALASRHDERLDVDALTRYFDMLMDGIRPR